MQSCLSPALNAIAAERKGYSAVRLLVIHRLQCVVRWFEHTCLYATGSRTLSHTWSFSTDATVWARRWKKRVGSSLCTKPARIVTQQPNLIHGAEPCVAVVGYDDKHLFPLIQRFLLRVSTNDA